MLITSEGILVFLSHFQFTRLSLQTQKSYHKSSLALVWFFPPHQRIILQIRTTQILKRINS